MPALVYAFLHLALARIDRAPHAWLTPLFQVRRLLLATAVPLLCVALVRLEWLQAALLAASTLTFLDRYARAAHPLAASPPSAERPGFRVCTLNAGAHRSDPAQIARFLAGSGADVVALQEIGANHVETFERELADLYPHRVLLGRGISGIGVLSKHAILEDELIELEGPHPYLSTTIDVHGAPVEFVAVHPMVSIAFLGDCSPSGRDCRELARRAASGAPCVVLGDFNTTDETEAYDVFARAGLSDAFRATGGGWGPTFPVPVRYLGLPVPPLVRIDFVLHTAHLAASAARVGPDAGSDHYPVIAELAWVEVPAAAGPYESSRSTSVPRVA
ncbi:MAG: hypothetical protein GY711_06515 [bacterium]|nr:hypothetical protein [bacterium]